MCKLNNFEHIGYILHLNIVHKLDWRLRMDGNIMCKLKHFENIWGSLSLCMECNWSFGLDRMNPRMKYIGDNLCHIWDNLHLNTEHSLQVIFQVLDCSSNNNHNVWDIACTPHQRKGHRDHYLSHIQHHNKYTQYNLRNIWDILDLSTQHIYFMQNLHPFLFGMCILVIRKQTFQDMSSRLYLRNKWHILWDRLHIVLTLRKHPSCRSGNALNFSMFDRDFHLEHKWRLKFMTKTQGRAQATETNRRNATFSMESIMFFARTNWLCMLAQNTCGLVY